MKQACWRSKHNKRIIILSNMRVNPADELINKLSITKWKSATYKSIDALPHNKPMKIISGGRSGNNKK